MEAKSTTVSLRLRKSTDRLIAREAKRSGRSKGAVVSALAEEALKTQIVPGIAFRGEGWNRRAWVIGTALDVWEVVVALKDFASPREMAKKSELSQRQIATALTYYERFPEEIDLAIEENALPVDELKSLYPFADVAYTDSGARAGS